MTNLEISEEAIKFVKSNKKAIIAKFASIEIYKPFTEPATFFMAGSPGAGKTETSRDFIAELEHVMSDGIDVDYRIVRIDGDEIRKLLPGYTGNNSDLFQEAISTGVNKLIDHCFDKKLNMLVDGTFSKPIALKNLERAISHKRTPHIFMFTKTL